MIPNKNETHFTTFANYYKNTERELYEDPMEAYIKVYLYRTDLFFFFQAEDGIRDHCVTGVQTWLFRSPSDKGKGPDGARLSVTDAQVEWLEGEIDKLNTELAPLQSFILPGGSPAAAYLHLARTVCRRAERIMVELKDKPGERVTPAALKYVNRLSDFLFVSSRFMNDNGATDVLWVPGQNR